MGFETITGPLAHSVVGLFLILISFVVVIMSNFVNNAVTVAFFIPLMIILAHSFLIAGGYTKLLALPVALAVAVAFMTPVAHPLSTLIHGTGMIFKRDMFKSGLVIAIPSIIIAVVWIHWRCGILSLFPQESC